MSSFEKTFAVLEAIVAEQNPGLSFSAIVAETGLPKASVHRVLKGLTELGYLNFDVEKKQYQGSLKLASLGAEVVANLNVRNLLHPQLLKLHRETNHTCNIAILENDHGIFIDKIESQDYGIRLVSGIGKSFPLHATALGKVLLAHDNVTAERLLRRKLPAYTDHTITHARALRQELEVIRSQGYAIDNEEITRGIICVAAPVYGVSHEVICSISLAFPSYVANDRGIDPEIDALRRYSQEMSGSFQVIHAPAEAIRN